MKRWLGLLVVLTFPVLACAHGGVDATRRSVEASMLVTGEIAVNPDGSVYGYSLDHREKLPAAVIKLIGEALPGWRFTPVEVDGKAVLAKAMMSLRIVAYQDKPGHFVIRVAGAEFGNDAALYEAKCPPGACLTYAKRYPPSYPLNLAQDGVSGTVYVVVEVDRQGHVADAAVRQVNLRRLGDATQLKRWRRELASNTLSAMHGWTFNVPTLGDDAKNDQWVVTIPVNYGLNGQGEGAIDQAGYGQWDSYVPGPVHPMPWEAASVTESLAKGSSDAIPDNSQPFMVDPRFVLLTPIGGDEKPQTGAAPGQG